MNAKDRLCKAVWNLMESVRDTTVRSVISVIKEKNIDLKQDQIEVLINVINSSISSSYHNGMPSFSRTVEITFDEETKNKKQISKKS